MRRVAQNASLVIASLVVFILLLEGTTRFIDGVPLFKAENFLIARLNSVTRVTANRFDPLVGWVPIDYYKPPDGGPAQFGKYGIFLKPGEPLDPPQGAILAVGDSFTAGSDVPTDKSWPAQLQQELGEPVINAAGGGYALDQIVLRAASLLDVLHPDIVIVSIVADDIARNGYQTFGGANKPYFLVQDGKLVPRNDPVPRFEQSNALGPALSALGYSYAVDWYLRWAGYSALEYGLKYRQVKTDEGAVSCLLLYDLKQQTEARGIKLLVLFEYGGLGAVRYKTQSQYPPYMEKTLNCVRDDQIESVDLWPDFKERIATSMEAFKALWNIYPGDIEGGRELGGWYFGHPSAAGHALTARRIAEKFRALGWISSNGAGEANH